MTTNEPDMGEQAISKVAEISIKSQLDEAEELDVDVRTNPVKLVQGEVDSIEIHGKGLVMKQDLRMEELEVNADSIGVNPLSVVFGNVELTKPTNATSHAVLTEVDLNRALGSSYLLNKLQNIEVSVEGQPTKLNVRKAEVRLLGEGKLSLATEIYFPDKEEKLSFSVLAIPYLDADGNRIRLEILSAEGHGLTVEFAAALFENLVELLDLRNFELPGMSLQLKQLDVKEGLLELEADTQIRQLP